MGMTLATSATQSKTTTSDIHVQQQVILWFGYQILDLLMAACIVLIERKVGHYAKERCLII
jgi:hypothetical protein